MPIAKSDQLFLLIKSLTKAEKRNFMLFVNRSDKSGGAKFLKLFEVLDKIESYDERLILKKLSDVEKKQLPNLKRHLYKQILVSLRLIYAHKNIDMQIREQLDFARILYGKGMYMQSLKLLERVEKLAFDNHQDLLHLEVLEFQKTIEARHITRSRSVKNKMENLLNESERRSRIAHITSKLSNLNIKIQGWYIQFGHIRSQKEAAIFKEYFNANISAEDQERQLTFLEKVNLYQANMWYHYVLLDMNNCEKFAQKWVDVFITEPQMKEMEPDLYIRGLYYLLTYSYFNNSTDTLKQGLQLFDTFLDSYKEQLNTNSQVVAFTYLNLSKLNYIFLTENYAAGLPLIEEIEPKIPFVSKRIDIHRVMLFYYKFSYLHFCLKNYDKALDYIKEVINHKASLLSEELHINARLLQLMCNYEKQEFHLLNEYLIPAAKRSLGKSNSLGQLPKMTLDFIREIARINPDERTAAFEKFALKLDEVLNSSPIEKKSRIYLNVPLWVKNHLDQKVAAPKLMGNL